MRANAVFALRIDVPVPVGIFKRYSAKLPKEGFLISRIPENCIPLNRYAELRSGWNSVLYALLRLAVQVSPFGVFREDLSAQDILVQVNTNRPVKCYLANYTSFSINRFLIQKNRPINTHIINRLLQIDDVSKNLIIKKSPYYSL